MPQDAGPSLTPPVADPALLRVRSVHRAIADLRRGTPVLLMAETPLVVLAAETAGAQGLAEMAGLAAGAPCLLLAPVRAAALLRRPVAPAAEAIAFRTQGLLDPDILRSMADPTLTQLLPEPLDTVAAPDAAPAALALAKLARLLPAAIVAPARSDQVKDAAARADGLGLLRVAAEDVLALPGLGRGDAAPGG